MQALARFIMRGPSQAILVATGFGLLSILPIFGFLGVVSGAAVALVTLRHGAKQGFMVVAGATLVVAFFMLLAQGQTVVGWILSLVMWLPVWALALVLRNTVSWSKTLNAVAILAFVVLTLVYTLLGDPVQFWQQALKALMDMAASQGSDVDMATFKAQLPAVAEWLTGVLVAALSLGLIASLALARWWQSTMFNPGGFRQEFHGLSLRRETSMVVLVLLLISMFGPGVIASLASDLMMTVMLIYSIVGLGFVHHLIAVTGRSTNWLVALYVMMLFALPHIVAMLAAVGFADSWTNFRARLPQATQKDGRDKRDEDQN
ncbi:MAG TPA: DUF2232 domain-containing protein [Candidatus Tenderia sp.]|nr:DUF2232 domain-containing protein [Candidatus Tenderia sp.]